jgi:hypothetical protein
VDGPVDGDHLLHLLRNLLKHRNQIRDTIGREKARKLNKPTQIHSTHSKKRQNIHLLDANGGVPANVNRHAAVVDEALQDNNIPFRPGRQWQQTKKLNM